MKLFPARFFPHLSAPFAFYIRRISHGDLLLYALSFLPSPTFAQFPGPFFPGSRRSLDELIRVGINFIFLFVGVGSLIAIIWGGYRYMTGGGDKYQIENARSTVTNGIVGLVVTLVAYLITATLWSFLTGRAIRDFLPGGKFLF